MFAAVPFCKPIGCLRGLLVSQSLSGQVGSVGKTSSQVNLVKSSQFGQVNLVKSSQFGQVNLVKSSQVYVTTVQSIVDCSDC